MAELNKIEDQELKTVVDQQKELNQVLTHILFEDKDSSYNIFIKKNEEVLPWKKFNSNMAISIEYDLQY